MILDRSRDYGGRAISAGTILAHLPQLKQYQRSPENPFQPTAGAMEKRDLLFAREREIKEIFDFLNSGSGVAIIGETGMGKSSLLKAISQEASTRLKPPRKPIYFNLGIVSNDEE